MEGHEETRQGQLNYLHMVQMTSKTSSPGRCCDTQDGESLPHPFFIPFQSPSPEGVNHPNNNRNSLKIWGKSCQEKSIVKTHNIGN
jgi:hypothetical protein